MPAVAEKPIVYPESDGQPVAENTVQFDYIDTIRGGCADLVAGDPNAVAIADNLIYPVEGRPDISAAPDVYVAFGRPKGDRGCYKVWEEGGVFPQVVFEIQSPSNKAADILRKFAFYNLHGAEEYYHYDPDENALCIYVRGPGGLEEVPDQKAYVSNRLGIRFDTSDGTLVILNPDGSKFETYQELRDRVRREQAVATAAVERAEKLAAQLKALGIDPTA